MSEFDSTLTRSSSLDSSLLSSSNQVSEEYAHLVTLSARQTLASIEFTSSSSTAGVEAFMKDIGTSQRITPIHTLFSSFPLLVYLNSSWAGYLLEPVMKYSNTDKVGVGSSVGNEWPLVGGQGSSETHTEVEG